MEDTNNDEKDKKRRTANLFDSTFDRLDALKDHPRQSYDEVINKALDKLDSLESEPPPKPRDKGDSL